MNTSKFFLVLNLLTLGSVVRAADVKVSVPQQVSNVIKSNEYFPIYSRVGVIHTATGARYEKSRTFYALVDSRPGLSKAAGDFWDAKAVELLKSSEDSFKIDFSTFLKQMNEPTSWATLTESDIEQTKFEGVVLENGKFIQAKQIDLPGNPVRRANRSMYFCDDDHIGTKKKQGDPYLHGLRIKE